MKLMINTQLGMRIYGGKNQCNVKAGQLKQDSQKPYWVRKPLNFLFFKHLFNHICVTKQKAVPAQTLRAPYISKLYFSNAI